MKLTSENVHNVFMDCLFSEDEDTSNAKICEGVMTKVGLHRGRLESHIPDVKSMLDDLPDSFKKTSGGGMSFLNMCEDKNGEQWTGMHQTMDELICLGIGIDKLSFLMEREMWNVLPGGMPYLVIDL